MSEKLQELWRFRELLRQMVSRELKVRYKNSILGFLWSIIPPILQVLVYSFLIRGMLKVPARNYSAYLLCGLIPWTFTSVAILDASMSLLANYTIIKKVYMPREVIPLAFVISNFIHMVLAWVVYFVAFFGVARLFGVNLPILATALWFPVITLMLLCFVAGCALWIATLNVFYEDIKFIVQTLFGLMLFLLPIIFPSDVVYYNHTMKAHPWLFKLYMLNPIATFITAYRKTLLEPVPIHSFNMPGPPLPMDWPLFAGACVISIVVLITGYWYFTLREWQFVEQL